ncbi:MAG: hypothetical protein IJU42_02825 [Erysipelotrichaceae bacterium]|nr:hypothetical protein [Erysipelotrichaceae bacterium]
MKKTAGFLKFFTTVALVFEIASAVLLGVVVVALLMAGSFSALAEKGGIITVSGGTMTPEEMDALKPIVLAALGLSLAALIMTIIGTQKTRTALGECKEERPFSEKCVKALKTSARMDIIGGIFGIVTAIALSLMASSVTVNGASVGKTSSNMSLTWLFYAVLKYLLYHIASYGHSLETDPERQ